MMNTISYTQPVFTKEDEELEQAKLTHEERESIEDDLKGRLLEDVVVIDNDGNVENNNNENIGEQQQQDGAIDNDPPPINNAAHQEQDNDDDINPHLLLDFMTAIDGIPFEDKSDYMRALVINEGLFETECNPILFLRRENYNAELAAKRMVKYWQMRVRLFGDERAFLPMTLSGALQNDIDSWKCMPNWFCLLPTDIKGRTVMYRDIKDYYDGSTNETSLFSMVRIAWYVVHVALQRHHTQMHGLVLVGMSRGLTRIAGFNRKRERIGIVSVVECLPIKFCALHACPSGTVARLILPAIRVYLSKIYRTRHIIHSPELSATELCRDLGEYGLLRDRLPPRVGGTYDLRNWLQQRLEIEGL